MVILIPDRKNILLGAGWPAKMRRRKLFRGPACSYKPASLPRPLWQALILSVLLHGVFLLNVAPTLPVRLETSATRINAMLSPRVTVPPLAKALLKPVAAIRQPALPAPEKVGIQARFVPPLEAQAVPELNAHSDEAAHAASARPSAASSSASATGTQGVSADDLRQYRLSLAIAARRFKRYPALARERGWEGTVEVAISLIALLPTPQIGLASSSGRSVLDEQALEMLAQAARSTDLPESLKGRDLRLLLPVTFSLELDGNGGLTN